MKKEKNIVQEQKPQKTKVKMTFAILCLAVLFIVELYLMMNYSKEYLFLGIAGLGILCLVYIVTDLSFKMQREKESFYEKEYENIYKAQKVSYVFLKQSFMDMEKILERIEENTEVPAEELIEAQKAVGKITIQKNRENAASVLNSNEKVIHHIISLEDKVKEAVHSIEESSNASNAAPDDRQQEIIDNLAQNQIVLKEELNRLAEQMNLQNHEILDAVKKSLSENAAMLEEHIVSEISVKAEENFIPKEAAESDRKEMVIPEEPDTAEMVMPAEDDIVSEMVTAEDPVEEESVLTESPLSGESVMTEEIMEPAKGEKIAEPKESVAEEVNAAEEIAEPEEIVTEEPADSIETVTEGAVIEEQPAEEKPQENEMSLEEMASSGKMMTPEEIAALLEESNAAEEPQEPVKEEKPSMPDLSDPGHVMTPEEIAALLANM